MTTGDGRSGVWTAAGLGGREMRISFLSNPTVPAIAVSFLNSYRLQLGPVSGVRSRCVVRVTPVATPRCTQLAGESGQVSCDVTLVDSTQCAYSRMRVWYPLPPAGVRKMIARHIHHPSLNYKLQFLRWRSFTHD